MSLTLSSAQSQLRENHIRRAGELALKASALLNLDPEERTQVLRAIHSDVEMRIARGACGLELAVAAEMRMIGFQSDSIPPAVGADLLSAALEFDDAAESAALDSVPLAAHLEDYLVTAQSFHRADTMAALKGAAIQESILAPANLPVLPTAMMQLLRTREDSVAVTTLCDIASADPVLTARLLGVANSMCNYSGYAVTRLLDATLRIGVPTARKVLFAACAGNVFASARLHQLWKHSQTVAAAAAKLAEAIEFDDDLAYAAGLLHDIGRLRFSTAPNSKQRALHQWLDNGFPLVYAETLAYGSNHASAGAELLREWGLPDAICDAIEMHQSPELPAGGQLSAILFVAEVWSQRKFDDDPEEGLNTNLRLGIACELAGLPENVLQSLGTESPLFQFALAG